eukprot:m.148629 g.148629  ORF g.148629 m.148629 type:complete len:89 (+) comp14188_c1_seq4:1787-2053(+)
MGTTKQVPTPNHNEYHWSNTKYTEITCCVRIRKCTKPVDLLLFLVIIVVCVVGGVVLLSCIFFLVLVLFRGAHLTSVVCTACSTRPMW